MKLTGYRLFNRQRLLLMALSLLGIFINWIFDSGFFQIITENSMRSPDWSPELTERVKVQFFENLTMDKYMDTMGYTTTIMLVLLFSTVVLFYQEKNGLFSFRYVRGESHKKVVISTILNHALINAVSYYLIYVIYLSAGYLFIGDKVGYIPRNIFDGIFGQGFSERYPYMYYLAEGVPPVFIGTFVYSVMSCAVALFCRKAYQAVICMFSYFWGVQIVLEFLRCTFLGPKLAWIVGTFEPTFLYGFYGYVYQNPSMGVVFQAMSSLIVPIFISVVLLVITFRKEEKLYE